MRAEKYIDSVLPLRLTGSAFAVFQQLSKVERKDFRPYHGFLWHRSIRSIRLLRVCQAFEFKRISGCRPLQQLLIHGSTLLLLARDVGCFAFVNVLISLRTWLDLLSCSTRSIKLRTTLELVLSIQINNLLQNLLLLIWLLYCHIGSIRLTIIQDMVSSQENI